MTIDYYIGVAVGIISVLAAYFVSRLTKRDSMCDKCKHMTFKDWNGKRRCRYRWKCFYITPKYCADYKEKEDEHGIT